MLCLNLVIIMKKQKKNIIICRKIGIYYYQTEINYPLMKQYYLIAVKLGNIKDMTNLGNYYYSIEKVYTQMKLYYQMAAELSDYKLMNRYYQMALNINKW